jgi:hypothetical protein
MMIVKDLEHIRAWQADYLRGYIQRQEDEPERQSACQPFPPQQGQQSCQYGQPEQG